ncbi:hypothetical protein B9Z55_016864 [Caenorhabditis nigoni]|uniref:Tyrosine-protein phosphatase domain-containing protein n=1 Tax=Caenorhabditis nigoni TaxID=1611254 RepID=A0A2G5T710_9PELO|nr:hypothetical protein B9Z55_016864 [Caenorhabditis nigoni]
MITIKTFAIILCNLIAIANGFSPGNTVEVPDTLRFRRATNEEFASTIHKLQKFARIINGISLQQGITNGTLPTDIFISEILNFGSITSSQIYDFNTGELSQLVNGIRNFSLSLKVDDELTKIENRLIILGSIYKETHKGQKVEKLNPKYLEAAKKLKATNVDWDQLNSMVKIFADLSNTIDSLKPSEQKIGPYLFKQLKLGCEAFQELDISIQIDALKADILRKTESFDTLSSLAKSINITNDKDIFNANRDPETFSTLQRQLEYLGNAIDSSNEYLVKLALLKQIFSSRIHASAGRVLSQTSGLLNGVSDLESIHSDLTDPWVKEVVHGQAPNLVKSMDQLKKIANNARSVSDAFGSDSVMTMNEIASELKKLAQTKPNISSVAVKLTSISKDAQQSITLPRNGDEYMVLYKNIKELAGKLNSIDQLLATFSDFHTKRKPEVQAIISLTSSYSEENLKKLKEAKEYQDLSRTILSLKPHIDMLKMGASIVEPLDAVIKDVAQVDIFVSELDPFAKMVDILKKTPELEQAEDVINVLRESRSIKIESFDPVATRFDDVKIKLKTFEKSLIAVSNSTEANALIGLKDLLHDSQNIGSYSRVMTGTLKASEQKLLLDETKINSISKEIDPDIFAKINGLNASLQKTYNEIDTLRDSMKAPTTSNLSSLYSNLEQIKLIGGIDMDFLEIGRHLEEKSENSTEKNILEIKASLDTLDTFGLNFTLHRTALNGVKESLDSLDAFFVAFAKKMAPRQSVNGPQPSQNVTEESVKETTLDPAFIEENWPYLLVGSVVLVGIGITGFIVYRRKKAARELKEQLNAKLDDGEQLQKTQRIEERAKFHVPIAPFQLFLSDWTFKLAKYQVDFLPFIEWADTFNLYFMSLYAQDSMENNGLCMKPTAEQAKWFRNPIELSMTDLLTILDAEYKCLLHANLVRYPNGLIMVLSQIPHLAVTDAKNPKFGNIPQYWYAVFEKQSDYVVCLSDKVDGKPLPYLPLTSGEIKQYDKGLIIKCESVEYKCGKQLVIRKLCVMFPNKPKFYPTHLQFTGWPDGGIPKSTDALIEIFKMVEQSPYPVFVNCEDGVSKSGTFAQAVMTAQKVVECKGVLSMSVSLNSIRQSRAKAVPTKELYMFQALLGFRIAYASVDHSRLHKWSIADIEKFDKFLADVLAGKIKIKFELIGEQKEKASRHREQGRIKNKKSVKKVKDAKKSKASKKAKSKKAKDPQTAKKMMPPSRFPDPKTFDPENPEDYLAPAESWLRKSQSHLAHNHQKKEKLDKSKEEIPERPGDEDNDFPDFVEDFEHAVQLNPEEENQEIPPDPNAPNDGISSEADCEPPTKAMENQLAGGQ